MIGNDKKMSDLDSLDLSEEELVRDWTLSEKDLQLLSQYRKHNRQDMAIQICAMRLFGRMLDGYVNLSPKIINYINQQLDLPPSLYISSSEREKTYFEHRKRIFEYLNFAEFNNYARALLKKWVAERVRKYGVPLAEELLPDAEQFLLKEKIALPGQVRLERFLSSICVRYQENIFGQVYAKLTPKLIQAIDELLHISRAGCKSQFSTFKEYPPSATITSLQIYLNRYQQLVNTGIQEIDLTEIEPKFSQYIFKLGKYYDASDIKRLKVKKRYAIATIFLHKSSKIILDYLIEMHDQYISNIYRETKNAYEEKYKQSNHRREKALEDITGIADVFFDADIDEPIYPRTVYKKLGGREKLLASREDIRAHQDLSKYGFAEMLLNRYSSMRKYFSDFLKLPFKAEKGTGRLLQSIDILKQLDNGALKNLPNKIPTSFIDKQLQKNLYNEKGNIRRNVWELGVALAMKEALRSRDLYVPQSVKHVSFWNLVYSDSEWLKRKDQAYIDLGLKQNPDEAIDVLCKKLHKTAMIAKEKFGLDGFAYIQNHELKLHKDDKIEESIEVKRLEKVLESTLPKIRIEQLLLDVDQMTGFSRHFVPIHGQQSLPKKFYKTLLASIIAQATNIGIVGMHNCVTDITIDMMRHVNHTCIREETIKAANAEIVNRHTKLPLSLLHGAGELSSSDNQRFGIIASSIIASIYPRYFGYYEKAVGVYTHISNQSSVYGTRAISCAPRESLYVLDGLLENDTILEIKEHTTDTGGYTEHIFALCYLLGYEFMPRIKDLKDQQLYKIYRDKDYGELNLLLTKNADISIVAEQWDQMVKVATSLKQRLTPANEIVRRLIKGSPSDRLAKAFTNLGRIVKTEYILRYLTTPDLRRKIQRQLNKGEHRHSLARWVFFANQGEFQTGDYEEIMNKASCLSLVSNAILYWNTIHIAEIIKQLRAQGQKIEDEDLSHISLLIYKHFIPMGSYFLINAHLYDYDDISRGIIPKVAVSDKNQAL